MFYKNSRKDFEELDFEVASEHLFVKPFEIGYVNMI